MLNMLKLISKNKSILRKLDKGSFNINNLIANKHNIFEVSSKSFVKYIFILDYF